jgi:hypothetical protein
MRTLLAAVLMSGALTANILFGQTYSNITYDAGTSLEIQPGADVCANNIYLNGTFSGTGTICGGVMPVTLSSFTASANNNSATLMWVTDAELNNSGFDVERRNIHPGANEWQKITFIQGSGTTNQPKGYLYEDKKLPKGTYQYRLKQIDYNGNYEYFKLEYNIIIAPPNKFNVSQNYPNPSNPKSLIDYEIPVNGKVTLIVFNIAGQEIATIVNEVKEAGYYTAEFNGSNLSSGVYFYRITADGEGQKHVKTMKMILVK